MRVAGVILAGGRSSRMEGADKALALLAGRPLAAHAAARLGPQVARMALSTNDAAVRRALPGLDALPDADDTRPGPLAGILAGLRWAETLPAPPTALVSAAVDTPFFPDDLVARLAAAADSGTIAVASSASLRHPTFALWPSGLAADLAAYLDAGERRVGAFIDRHRHVVVDFPPMAGGLDPFFNINTASDLTTAEAMMRGLHSL